MTRGMRIVQAESESKDIKIWYDGGDHTGNEQAPGDETAAER